MQDCPAGASETAGGVLRSLDLGREIGSVYSQKLGDTILLWGDTGLDAFAICHCGEESEAGRDNCYVKFGMARMARAFERLLDGCEAFAVSEGMSGLGAGVNLGRTAAHRHLRDGGFRTQMRGGAMHRANDPGYNRAAAIVIDDRR